MLSCLPPLCRLSPPRRLTMSVVLRRYLSVLAVLLSPALCHAANEGDCFEKAGVYQGVNPMLLRAIAWFESKGDPGAVHRNADGSIDIGQLQINSVHFSSLAKQGIPARALADACVNIYVAAWLLKQKMVKHGNTWQAVGAYHSETPDKRDAYARSIQKVLVTWGALPVAW